MPGAQGSGKRQYNTLSASVLPVAAGETCDAAIEIGAGTHTVAPLTAGFGSASCLPMYVMPPGIPTPVTLPVTAAVTTVRDHSGYPHVYLHRYGLLLRRPGHRRL